MKIIFLAIASVLLWFSQVVEAQAPPDPAKELVGLWEAKHRFGPAVRGTLLVKQSANDWRAEIAGRNAQVEVRGDSVFLKLPDGEGSFEGKFDPRRSRIVGHWIQPTMVTSGRPYASPVTLTKDRQNIWHGEVSPLEDEFTFYLMVAARNDNSVAAFLRNPERNVGRFIRIDRLERNGNSVKLLSANSANEQGRVLVEGKYDAENKIMSIYFPNWRVTFDFRRRGVNEASDFYPRGYPTAQYI